MSKIGKKRSLSSDSDDYKDKDESKKVKGPIQIKLAALSNSIKPKSTSHISEPTTTNIKTIKSNTSLSSTKKEPVEKIKVAAIFNNEDSDDEPEEMPPECRMRMRNIGRDTPTSCGPNSFGKTKYGFCDSTKLFEKNLKLAMELVSDDNKEE